MTPRCLSCPESCPLSQRPRHLCGTDQRTYSSPCHLKQASCLAGAVILRAYKGPCQGKAALVCGSFAHWEALIRTINEFLKGVCVVDGHPSTVVNCMYAMLKDGNIGNRVV